MIEGFLAFKERNILYRLLVMTNCLTVLIMIAFLTQIVLPNLSRLVARVLVVDIRVSIVEIRNQVFLFLLYDVFSL